MTINLTKTLNLANRTVQMVKILLSYSVFIFISTFTNVSQCKNSVIKLLHVWGEEIRN